MAKKTVIGVPPELADRDAARCSCGRRGLGWLADRTDKISVLLAERQQAQEERDAALHRAEIAEIALEDVRDQRQQAIDALREIAKTEDSFQAQSRYTGTVATAHHDCPSLARAALVKLGEQP